MNAGRACLGILLAGQLVTSAQAHAQDADVETAPALQELPPGVTVADAVLDGCCDYFSFGFCLDTPFGTTVERTDSARVDTLHDFISSRFTSDMSFTGLASGVITYSVYEGSAHSREPPDATFEPAVIDERAIATFVGRDGGDEIGIIVFEAPYDGWPPDIGFWYRAPLDLAPVARQIARGIAFDGEDADKWSRECRFERFERN